MSPYADLRNALLPGGTGGILAHVSQVPFAEKSGTDYRCFPDYFLRCPLRTGVHEESSGGRRGEHDPEYRPVAECSSDSAGNLFDFHQP